MKCPKCGAQIRDDYKFCNSCGTSIATNTKADTDTSSNYQAKEESAGIFDDIGNKIKAVAWICFGLGIISSFLLGIYSASIVSSDISPIVTVILVSAIGSLLSWVGSLFIYGFGQLIENSDVLVADKMSHITANNVPDTLEEKIAVLTRCRQQGLITEEEYRQKVEKLR